MQIRDKESTSKKHVHFYMEEIIKHHTAKTVRMIFHPQKSSQQNDKLSIEA